MLLDSFKKANASSFISVLINVTLTRNSIYSRNWENEECSYKMCLNDKRDATGSSISIKSWSFQTFLLKQNIQYRMWDSWIDWSAAASLSLQRKNGIMGNIFFPTEKTCKDVKATKVYS